MSEHALERNTCDASPANHSPRPGSKTVRCIPILDGGVLRMPERKVCGAAAGRDSTARLGGNHQSRDWLIRQQRLDGDSAQLKQPANGILDEIVGTGSAGGDADGDFAGGQPVGGGFLDVLVLIPMPDQ